MIGTIYEEEGKVPVFVGDDHSSGVVWLSGSDKNPEGQRGLELLRNALRAIKAEYPTWFEEIRIQPSDCDSPGASLVFEFKDDLEISETDKAEWLLRSLDRNLDDIGLQVSWPTDGYHRLPFQSQYGKLHIEIEPNRALMERAHYQWALEGYEELMSRSHKGDDGHLAQLKADAEDDKPSLKNDILKAVNELKAIGEHVPEEFAEGEDWEEEVDDELAEFFKKIHNSDRVGVRTIAKEAKGYAAHLRNLADRFERISHIAGMPNLREPEEEKQSGGMKP